MAQPIWRKIVHELQVPKDPTQQWTLALDLLTKDKIVKIEVVVDTTRVPPITGQWTPLGFPNPCTADGVLTGAASGSFTLPGTPVSAAPIGALIARIGGSTADLAADTAASPNRILFSVGRECVFTVPASPAGSLFLGINDDATRMVGFSGALIVNIYEAV